MPFREVGANQLVEAQLGADLAEIERIMGADCLTYVGSIAFGADDDIRDAVEAIKDKKSKLVCILETIGGYTEAARRIADTFRHHYSTVDFLIPNYALSAGTILVMSGDAIHMDYYSILGPIDPQIEGPDGNLIPALGYLIRYEDLLAKANDGKITPPEMDILLGFDQGQLYSFEQARDLSVALLEEWLCKYKFKNWIETETRGMPVSEEMKRDRANEIANSLNNVKIWRSHGLGINMHQLRDILNLKIDDFGKVSELNKVVRRYHKLLSDYMSKMRHRTVVQTREEYAPLIIG